MNRALVSYQPKTIALASWIVIQPGEEIMSVAPDHAEIVRELTQYIIDFVERPHPKLGNLPVCPFARKARLEKRIQFEVMELTRDGVLALAASFTAKPDLHLMICIHPHKDGLSSARIHRLAKVLNQALPAMNLMAIGLHPDDPFNIDGLYTRREPYPNIQVLRLDVGAWAHESIKHSGYYDRWTESNVRDITAGLSHWPRPLGSRRIGQRRQADVTKL